MNNHNLDIQWTLWYHDPDDKKWDINSYKKLIKFNTLEKFLTYYESIGTFINGMFFLMKEDIIPIWEDSNNINGGIITYKLLKNNSNKTWEELSMLLVGGTLTEDYSYINGISISPKINNCIIKIWVNDSSKINIIKFNNNIDLFQKYQPIHKVFK
jgi:translation initiation factor 4E